MSAASSATGAVGVPAQVGALLRARAAALRGGARVRAVLGLVTLPVLFAAAVGAGLSLPPSGGQDARLLMPTAWTGFALTIVLAAGTQGVRTLLPRAQAVAFPVAPAAEYLGGLLLAPLNVAWVVQALALVTLSTWGFAEPSSPVRAIALTLVWVLAVTMLAQAVGTAVELARTARSGPWALRALVAAGLLAAGGVAVTGRIGSVLDHLPTVWPVAALAAAEGGPAWPWLGWAAGLLAAGLAAHVGGVRLTVALHRRAPRDQAKVEARAYPARPDPGGDLAAALRVDRAGVWRSAPLRRGMATLVAVPAVAAAVAGLDWPLVTLLPGLVASGAGLLFGVNALALDGPGALWRESLPAAPRILLLARLLVVGEICLGSAALAAVVGAVRAPGPPSVAVAVAVGGAVVATSALVVGRCARWSVRRPYAAALRDARDQPAPPVAMAGYSARLAITTTICGLAFSVCARYELGLLAVCLALAVVADAARHVTSALRRWDDPGRRSHVIATVAAG